MNTKAAIARVARLGAEVRIAFDDTPDSVVREQRIADLVEAGMARASAVAQVDAELLDCRWQLTLSWGEGEGCMVMISAFETLDDLIAALASVEGV